MQILTTAIQKGGTGKTTTAAVLTQAAAYKGKRVLAIDLDPQGNLSFALGADITTLGSYELLNGADPAQTIQRTGQNIDVIAASRNLATLETYTGSARRLQNALDPLKKRYDLIIIDTPPTAGELQYNALQASTGLIIPLEADIYNLQAIYQMTEIAAQIQQSNPKLKIKGVVFTKYDGRSTLAKQMHATLKDRAKEIGIKSLGEIRNGVAIKEAAALQISLYEYAPKSKPAQDYLELFDTLKL